MKEIILASIAVVLGVAAICSAFAYAAFEVRWWVPIDSRETLRDVALAIMHMLSIAASIPALHYLLWRFRDE